MNVCVCVCVCVYDCVLVCLFAYVCVCVCVCLLCLQTLVLLPGRPLSRTYLSLGVMLEPYARYVV